MIGLAILAVPVALVDRGLTAEGGPNEKPLPTKPTRAVMNRLAPAIMFS